MVDNILILRKLADLQEYIGQVREYSNIKVAEYSKDWKTQRIVERTLQMMIEICADIASHIISDSGFRVPQTYADAFKVLYEKEIIPKGLFTKLVKMARFRNIIVHQYDKIDGEIVVGILKKDLNDFVKYKDAIINIIKEDKAAN
jgi:uncharacterized protein YutE (UPF0331/DUF86 family)